MKNPVTLSQKSCDKGTTIFSIPYFFHHVSKRYVSIRQLLGSGQDSSVTNIWTESKALYKIPYFRYLCETRFKWANVFHTSIVSSHDVEPCLDEI